MSTEIWEYYNKYHDEIMFALIQELKKMPLGGITSTPKIVRKRFPDMFDAFYSNHSFFIYLHTDLMKNAKQNSIILETSLPQNESVTEPYDLSYAVFIKEPKVKCPRCGGLNTSRIEYREQPGFDGRVQQNVDDREKHVTEKSNGNDYNFHCFTCKKDFGTRNLMDADGMARYLIDNAVKFVFAGVNPTGESKRFTLERKDYIYTGTVEKVVYMKKTKNVKTVDFNHALWTRTIEGLCENAFLLDWQNAMDRDPMKKDSYWMVEITLRDGKVIRRQGTEKNPPYWTAAIKILENTGCKI